MVTSMARRYSVSASKSPATKAPSAIDRWLAAAASPSPSTTKQARRHEEFRALRFGDEMEEGPQSEAAENDERRQPQRRRDERAEKL